MATEQSLGANDIISFGFNTASIYDVNDKNAFIYRLVKEVIETIDIDDSDDEIESAPPPARGKVIEIANKVIDIPSDSDSNYSGDECLQNIDEIEQQESDDKESASDSSVESVEQSEYSDSEESEIESDDDNFVVTKTIVKCPTPTETISLDEDDENEAEPKKDEPNDETAHQSQERRQTEKSNDKSANGTLQEPTSSKYQADDSKSNEIETTASTVNVRTNVSKESDKSAGNDNAKESTAAEQHKKQFEWNSNKDETYRLDCLKRRLAENVPRKITTIQPRPLKKRRETITEFEYKEKIQAKKLNEEERKQLRRERLANLANEQKVKRDEAAEYSADSDRVPFVPKVKNTVVSRGEQLATDLLALNPTNT